jgi:hypothetical protein
MEGDAGARGPVTGVVLAGGRSRRFGRDKLSEPYRGRPLLHHAVGRLIEVCDEVVVVLAPETAEPAMPPGAGVRFARDELEGSGPLAGALAGLEAADGEWIVLAGGDMPDLRPAVLLEMLRASDEMGVVAASPPGGAACGTCSRPSRPSSSTSPRGPRSTPSVEPSPTSTTPPTSSGCEGVRPRPCRTNPSPSGGTR